MSSRGRHKALARRRARRLASRCFLSVKTYNVDMTFAGVTFRASLLGSATLTSNRWRGLPPGKYTMTIVGVEQR